MTTWKSQTFSSETSNLDFYYGDQGTNGMMYNLYADVLLGLNFVPSDVYSVLTTYYNNLISCKSP